MRKLIATLKNKIEAYKKRKKRTHILKRLRRVVKKVTKREVLMKILVVVSALAMLSTAILPYILR